MHSDPAHEPGEQPTPETTGADASPATLTHAEFVAAYTSGRLRVDIDPKAAGKFIGARMLLPWVLLPLFGLAVACALNGAWIFCAIFFLGALGLRTLSRATAPGYVLHRALQDAAFYREVTALGLLHIQGN
ncbi:MAG TPA: hypothetical protein VH105_12570 [Burkholderiales bacterium]|jgi:hypothetical protein|nr:hypothetical protein [Burkholderiales bacterium]